MGAVTGGATGARAGAEVSREAGRGTGAVGGADRDGEVRGDTARDRPRLRPLRALLAALVVAALVVPLSGAARPGIPAPRPAALAPVTAATLTQAYAANRANAALASRMAAAHGDGHRAAAERALAAPGGALLAFDGRGPGLVTEVFGDLAHADRVAVLVPGSDTSLDTYARLRTAAASLHHRLTRTATPDTRTAVVAWLGYRTPGTVSTAVTTTARADEAAPRLGSSCTSCGASRVPVPA